jgi:hypothetical protein
MGDGTMLNIEVLLSVVAKPKGLSRIMSLACPRTPSRTPRDETKCMTPDSISRLS